MEEFGQLVKTNDGSFSLLHPELNETYHSNGGAKWEAKMLYCEASGFKIKLKNSTFNKLNCISVLDVGLGLGYNACSTIEAWCDEQTKNHLVIESLEYNNRLIEKLVSGQGEWQQNWPNHWFSWLQSLAYQEEVQSWCAEIRHPHHAQLKCTWKIHVGDAFKKISSFKNNFLKPWDFIWQDPFSPQKNPSMWDSAWFQLLAKNADAQTTLMTYSVAKIVREALGNGGWNFVKINATGPKRHWLKASIKINTT